MDIADALCAFPIILTEGAVIERLRREYEAPLDPFIYHAGFIYEKGWKERLRNIYRQYIDVAVNDGLPILIMTPTRRANSERVERTGFRDRDVNGDCVRFLQELRSEYASAGASLYIGGIMGCRGDAYQAGEALSASEGYRFHEPQAGKLAEAGVDFLFGATLPAVSEAIGLAQAMAQTGTPYILSFVIRPNGKLLDGTFLHDAIAQIDASVSLLPLGYMVNCVHPSVLLRALEIQENCTPLVQARLLGIEGNASARSPEELDGAVDLVTENQDDWVAGMVRLQREYQLRVFGGCCGTNERYIERLSSAFVSANAGGFAQHFTCGISGRERD